MKQLKWFVGNLLTMLYGLWWLPSSGTFFGMMLLIFFGVAQHASKAAMGNFLAEDDKKNATDESTGYFCRVQIDENGGCHYSPSVGFPKGTSFHCVIEPHKDGDFLRFQLQSDRSSGKSLSEFLDISDIHLFMERPEQAVLKCNNMDWVSVAPGCWLDVYEASSSEGVVVYEASARIYRTPAAIQKAWSSFSEEVQGVFRGIKKSGSSFADWLKEKYSNVSDGARKLGKRVETIGKRKSEQLSDEVADRSKKTKQIAKDAGQKASKKLKEGKEEVGDGVQEKK